MKMTEKEFRNQVLPCKDRLYRLAVSLLNDRAAAEDAVQEVYLKLWAMRRRLAEYDSIEALAVTMMKNFCIDKLRSYRSRKQNSGGLETAEISSDCRSPAQSVELDESLRQVHDMIQQLPDRQRMVLHLRDVEQYTYDEIEQMTEMSRNNIRVTLSRARKKVREAYLKENDYES